MQVKCLALIQNRGSQKKNLGQKSTSETFDRWAKSLPLSRKGFPLCIIIIISPLRLRPHFLYSSSHIEPRVKHNSDTSVAPLSASSCHVKSQKGFTL